MGQTTAESDGALTGEQLQQLSSLDGDGAAEFDRSQLHERVVETLHAEEVDTVDLDLGGGEVDVLTDTMRIYARIGDVSGRVRFVMAEARESGRVIAEGLPKDTVGDHPDVREKIEAAKRQREEYVPPEKYP